MIIALMAGWLVAGLLLALFVGGAVRVAEAQSAWHLPTASGPQGVTFSKNAIRS